MKIFQSWAVVVYVFMPTTGDLETDKSLSSLPAWYTEQVTELQDGQGCIEKPSYKKQTNKQNKTKEP